MGAAGEYSVNPVRRGGAASKRWKQRKRMLSNNQGSKYVRLESGSVKKKERRWVTECRRTEVKCRWKGEKIRMDGHGEYDE